MKRVLGALLLVASAVLAGCTGKSSTAGHTIDTTVTSTVTSTRSSAPSFKPAAASTVAPLPPGETPPKGEVEKACPYIATSQNQSDVSVADIEGDRIYRTTVISSTNPVGCRFYFYSGPFEAVADIVPRQFATATQAHDAMILTGQAGKEAQGKKNIVPGVDAVLYRTKFFGVDGDRDWACVFAKGRVMVIVHTQRKDQSSSALFLAQAIAPKF